MQSARRINNYYVRLAAFRRLHGVVNNRPGIGARLVRYDVHSHSFSLFLKLVDCRRPEGIGGGQQDGLAVFLQFRSQLGD